MASIRDTIIDARKATVATILKSGGYTENIGDHVFDYAALPQQLPTPCAIMGEGTEEVKEEGFGRYTRRLNLAIGFVLSYSGADPSGKAREVLADIQAVCGSAFAVTVPLAAGGTGTINVEVKELSNTIMASATQPGRVGGQVDYLLEYVTSRSSPRLH